MATAEFTAQFVPHPMDVEVLFTAILRRNPKVLRIRLIVAMCTALVGTAVGWVIVPIPVGAVTIGLGAAAIYWYSSREMASRMARRGVERILAHPESAALLSPLTIELLPDGMRIVTGEKDVTLPWSTFVRVESSADDLIVYKNDKEAVRVPRRAFANDTEWRSFVDYATARVHEARGAAA